MGQTFQWEWFVLLTVTSLASRLPVWSCCKSRYISVNHVVASHAVTIMSVMCLWSLLAPLLWSSSSCNVRAQCRSSNIQYSSHKRLKPLTEELVKLRYTDLHPNAYIACRLPDTQTQEIVSAAWTLNLQVIIYIFKLKSLESCSFAPQPRSPDFRGTICFLIIAWIMVSS